MSIVRKSTTISPPSSGTVRGSRMSSEGSDGSDDWMDDVPPEVFGLGLVLLGMWAVTPSEGLWILPQELLILGGVGLIAGLVIAMNEHGEAALFRSVGFVSLILRGKRVNQTQREKNPNQLSLQHAFASWIVAWVRHIRDTIKAAWTKTRRWITSSDRSTTDQPTEQPSAQSNQPDNDTTDE